MYSYELTERGKIIIAIVLVVLLLVVPSAILAYKAWASPPDETDDPPKASEPVYDPPDEPPPVIKDGPLPNGSGLNPPNEPPPIIEDPPQNGNGESGPHDPDPPHSSNFGLIDVNPSLGILSFFFAPDLQNTLDAGTVSKIGTFLDSPKNRVCVQIAVEMPLLSSEDSSKLISAIGNAFAPHGVTQDNLVYITYKSDVVEASFEVKMSFIQAPRPKQ